MLREEMGKPLSDIGFHRSKIRYWHRNLVLPGLGQRHRLRPKIDYFLAGKNVTSRIRYSPVISRMLG